MDATNSTPERLPASPAQAQLWLAEALDQGRGTLNDRLAVRLRGRLDATALRRAVVDLVGRHEPLRTVHHVADDTVIQEIRPAGTIEDGSVDYAERDVTGQDPAAARELAARLAWQPFDLAVDFPLRVRLLRLAADDHLLLVVLHHIASDLESPLIVCTDLERLYAAHAAGTAPDLPPLATRYADVARAQWERIETGGHDRLVNYWAERLRGVARSVALPVDREPGEERGRSLDRTLPAETGTAVRELARAHHLSVFAFTQTVFRLFLWRLCGQPDVLVASPMTQRTDAKLDGVIGPFLNVVALRNPVRPTATFLQAAAAERRAVLAGMAYGALPYGTVAELLGRRPEPIPVPPLEVLFAFEERLPFPTTFAGLAAEHVDLGEIAQHYQLAVKIVGTPEGPLGMRWTYSADFDRATVDRFAAGFEELLAAVLSGPDRAVETLPTPFRPPTGDRSEPVPVDAPGRPPEGITECYVADIWAELLDVEVVDDAETTIFALGGASMTVARLAARLTSEFGVRVTTVELFQRRTVAAQAMLLDDKLLADVADHDTAALDMALAAVES